MEEDHSQSGFMKDSSRSRADKCQVDLGAFVLNLSAERLGGQCEDASETLPVCGVKEFPGDIPSCTNIVCTVQLVLPLIM